MEPQETVADRLLSELLGRNNSRAEIHINAGGIGVWIATTCCCVMLAISVLMGLMLIDQSRKIDELTAYLTATYMIAPGLKPEDYPDRKKAP